jgi:peptidyl-prolyl cis-trans isomerase D
VFNVTPTAKDRQEIIKEIKEMQSEFAKTKDPVQYVNLYSDSTYPDIFYKKGDLPPVLDSFMFNSEPGSIYGPYEEKGAFKLAKLVSVNYLPDSVMARHILIDIQNQQPKRAKEIADSIFSVIKNGGNFAELAKIHSADQSNAQQGGELGWFGQGQMVKPFNDSVFFGEENGIYLVETRFGYHIVEVQKMSSKKKSVQVEKVVKNIEPGRATHDSVYAIANAFAGRNTTIEEFKESAGERGYQLRQYNNVLELSRGIPGVVEQARGLVKWVFEAEEGQVNPTLFEYGDMMIVAGVDKIREEGFANIEDVKDIIKPEILKQKKAEIIIDKISAGNSDNLKSIAENQNLQINKAQNVNFSAFSVPGAGVDPVLPAAAVYAPKDKLCGPIEGKIGVYMLTVLNINEHGEVTNYNSLGKTVESEYNNRTQFFEALRETAEIDDNRARFE